MDSINLNTDGALSQYQSVDIAAFPSEEAGVNQPQLMPTTHQPETSPEDLNFVSLSVEEGSSAGVVEGEMSAGQSLSGGEMGSIKPHHRTQQTGRAGKFLEGKGFGWLMEVEEEEEEENKPLLLVSVYT